MTFLVQENLSKTSKKTSEYTKEHIMGVLLLQEYFHRKSNYKKVVNCKLNSTPGGGIGSEKQNPTHTASFWKKADQKGRSDPPKIVKFVKTNCKLSHSKSRIYF